MNRYKLFKIVRSALVFLTAFSSISVFAAASFTLDTLIKVGNEKGHGAFTLKNLERETVYIKGTVSQIKVVDGEIKKIPLTRDNFPIWDLAINPSKLRLLPGEVRDVAIKYLCQEDCDRSKDLVYQIRFAPVSPPETPEGQKVVVSFGMAPYYITPALKSDVHYEWDYDEKAKKVTINNTGNTYLKVQFDNCNNNLREERRCKAVYHVLAGRYMEIDLPEGLIGNNVQVTVADHDQRYQDEFTL